MSIVIPQLKVIVADAMTAATVATMSVSGAMGQTLYVDAAADSFSASQSVAVVETALKTSSVDSFAISDSQTVLRKQHNVSAYDSFSCSESQSLLLKHLNLQVADSISASESQSYLRGQLVINPVDSFTASESSSIRQGQLILNPSDAFTSTDSATVSPQAAISGIVISTGDSINASQSQSFRIGQLVLNLADSFSLSDSNSNRVTPLRISSADGISASQSVTVTPSSVSVLTVSTGDSFSASDSRTVLEPRLIVSPYDSLSTSDYASTGGVVSILSISAYDRFVATGIPSFNWNRYNLSTHDSIYSWDVITKDLPGYAELTTETGPFSKLQYQPRGRNNWDDWDSWRNELIGTLRNTLNVGQWPDGGGYKKYPSGIPFPVYSSYYDFTAQEPGGTLTGSTPASVTLSPVPMGVNGTDSNHYLYVSGGTGTAEAVLITGGIAKSGGASGTIEFTPANNHSGAWTIASATAGIQEAIIASVTGSEVSKEVIIDSRSITVYQTVTIPTITNYTSFIIRGNGTSGTIINRGSTFPAGYVFTIDQTSGTPAGITLRDFSIFSAPYGGSWQNTSGGGIIFKLSTGMTHRVENVYILNAYNGIEIDSSSNIWIDKCNIAWTEAYLDNYAANSGILVDITSAGTKPTNMFVSDTTIYSTLSGTNRVTSAVILNSGDGITFSGCYIGQTAVGITVYPGASSFVDDVYVCNSILDGFSSAALSMNGGASSFITQFRIANSHLCNWSAASPPTAGVHIVNIVGSIVRDFQIVGCNIFGAPLHGILVSTGTVLEGGLIANNQIWGYDIDNNSGAGIALQNGAKNVTIVGNQIGTQTTNCAWATQKYGVLLTGTACSNLIIENNDLTGSGTAGLFVDTAYPTTSVIGNNRGIDDVIGSLASGASVTLPFNPIVKITGTTQITTITGGWAGRRVTMIFTNAAPGGLGTGGNVIRAITSTQNVPVELVFDGTNWY